MDKFLLFIAVLKQKDSSFFIEDFTENPTKLFATPDFQSSYYASEMGENLLREFYYVPNKTFSFLDLVEIKRKSKLTEDKFSKNNKRTVNLDPGMIGLHQVVVSTFKNYSHRIEIAPKIYADLQFTFMKNSFQELPWTYPDYKLLKNEFTNIRNGLL